MTGVNGHSGSGIEDFDEVQYDTIWRGKPRNMMEELANVTIQFECIWFERCAGLAARQRPLRPRQRTRLLNRRETPELRQGHRALRRVRT
jgi:hypothetical protein